jgi:antitoxin HicB
MPNRHQTPIQTLPKDLAYYLSLPYAVEILPILEEEGGGYTACIPRLGRFSAVGDGDTPEAAYADLRAALPSLITNWLAQGIALPEPGEDVPVLSYSGKLALRVPKSLHAQVAARARREGVSINQFIATTLAQEVGTPSRR